MIDWSPASREISLTVRWLWGLSWLSNSDSTVSTLSSVRALRLPLSGRLSTVLTSPAACWCCSPSNLCSERCYKQCRAFLPLHSYRFLMKILSHLLNSLKVAAFAWYSVKIGVIFGVRFERKKVDKKSNKPIWKLKHANSILESIEYFCQTSSKSTLIISSYTGFKLDRFWDTV